ncbi:hypothetical protein [Roseococcus pinisoli]|uniref:Uncharacterized protein n=1 Tax=Roseococcus pinisoli TaxID=2835040 RepID=A0ABS5QFA9_9PROT|nr:hypothetical protein [Roseococcus pinisoli]MBS7812380.1 hypothetical protein [Roseococcus pinisoli]
MTLASEFFYQPLPPTSLWKPDGADHKPLAAALHNEWQGRFAAVGLELPSMDAPIETLKPYLENALKVLMEKEALPVYPVTMLSHGGRKWRGMSAMQKGIRFGDPTMAARCASALARMYPTDCRRRLAVIALEDVGLANPWAATLANLWTANKKLRRSILKAPEDQAAWVAAALSTGAKTRDLCLLAVWAQSKMPEATYCMNLGLTEREALIGYAADQLMPVGPRLAAMFKLSGNAKWGAIPGPKGAGVANHQEMLRKANAPTLIQILSEANYRSCPDNHWVGLLISWEMLLAGTATVEKVAVPLAKIGICYAATFDKHVSEGKRSLMAFASQHSPLRHACEKFGVGTSDVIGSLAFYHEGALVTPHLTTPQTRKFFDAFIEARVLLDGVPNLQVWSELLHAFDQSLPQINNVRRQHAA